MPILHKYLLWRDTKDSPELVRSYLSEEDFIKSLDLQSVIHVRISYRKGQSKPIWPKKLLLLPSTNRTSDFRPF